MSKLPNPNQSQPFDTVYKDKEGNETYGERMIDGLKEIVDIQSGKSNMNYYMPEKVLSPEGCNHYFKFTNVPKREIECQLCNWALIVHPNNYFEKKGKAYTTFKGQKLPIYL